VDIVSVFRSKPALRWLVPSAAAVVIIGGGAAAGTIVASADSSLPDRSAAQLLVDVQSAKVDGFSGTIVESADLGLPAISGLGGDKGGAASLTSLIAGSNTARVWYAGEEKARLALISTGGETDVIRNGREAWLWSSTDKTATHLTMPADAGKKAPAGLPTALPSTPQDAAAAALAAIDPTTAVTTTGTAEVAGRSAYELVLSPKDTASLIGQVRLAIDAEKHIPLRVDVYAKNATSPAVRVAFQQISFTTPDAEQFTFTPPAGTKVNNATSKDLADGGKALTPEQKKTMADARGRGPLGDATVVGKGWTSVVKAQLPKPKAGEKNDLSAALNFLPKASGTWGSGHLFSGPLFSVLVTDNGTVFAGAVAPEALYQAAGAK
jgi:outer membrane lipoprotein-sorting protein